MVSFRYASRSFSYLPHIFSLAKRVKLLKRIHTGKCVAVSLTLSLSLARSLVRRVHRRWRNYNSSFLWARGLAAKLHRHRDSSTIRNVEIKTETRGPQETCRSPQDFLSPALRDIIFPPSRDYTRDFGKTDEASASSYRRWRPFKTCKSYLWNAIVYMPWQTKRNYVYSRYLFIRYAIHSVVFSSTPTDIYLDSGRYAA